eukprot:gb/GEZN01012837.1/.p1 GENE.gb/GEZN01012837.1/~~gb/GEZN01012837.1/.p1  ORF type:complete len:281 (-),score=11.18 gb/GEZN01012837.1/:47-889(-)
MWLAKAAAVRGLCSRREAAVFIKQGHILVNGEVVADPLTVVSADDELSLSAEARRDQGEKVSIIFHKPEGVVSSQPDGSHGSVKTPAISLLSPKRRVLLGDNKQERVEFDPRNLSKLAVAGRLDQDSTGLLIFTQDGRLAKQLLSLEKTHVEKEYRVEVVPWDESRKKERLSELDSNPMLNLKNRDATSLTPLEQLDCLREGLWLDKAPLRPARAEWLNKGCLQIILRQGKKRQIRRMCQLVGLHVVALQRVRVGQVGLGKLEPGEWRVLTSVEVGLLSQ